MTTSYSPYALVVRWSPVPRPPSPPPSSPLLRCWPLLSFLGRSCQGSRRLVVLTYAEEVDDSEEDEAAPEGEEGGEVRSRRRRRPPPREHVRASGRVTRPFELFLVRRGCWARWECMEAARMRVEGCERNIRCLRVMGGQGTHQGSAHNVASAMLCTLTFCPASSRLARVRSPIRSARASKPTSSSASMSAHVPHCAHQNCNEKTYDCFVMHG